MEKKTILAIIPARSGSKRIPNKNIKKFLGKPLIAYTIKQALSSPLVDRVIVDTDSDEIGKIARHFGAEVPWLRPKKLASDKANVVDSILYTLKRLSAEEGYHPTHLMVLQTTSPLREQEDIEACWNLLKKTKATTVLTVAPTHPKLYHLSKYQDTILVNGSEKHSNNTQTWEPAYILNGCTVYIVEVKALLREKRVITEKTKAVILPKWRSVDLDTPEEWVMAELFYKNKDFIKRRIKYIVNKV